MAILAAAQAVPVAASWGFARFVNVSDEHGATPLHLAARQGHPACVRLLLDKGAIVSAPTAAYGFPGSMALHLAARAGNLDCIRELLAWGADRLQRDSVGRIAYAVALKRGHAACAAQPVSCGAHGAEEVQEKYMKDDQFVKKRSKSRQTRMPISFFLSIVLT
ncbi:hypothetical protein GUJ93_ZPchr0001g32076 [Zizania palustris]|uniref:Uncharacterized protein n=1 Tax=Zizania palustris TaxID=103762 RepID=A0A8J5RMT3_ZIZPA|nr:hypothetical protein GUJ93_ZPchr0001g32076 [Zizania palustris]